MTTIAVDVRISKADVLGNELAGAELSLKGTDSEGNAIVISKDDITLGTGAELSDKSTDTELVWKSGTTESIISGLTDGKYTLHEIAAPNGFEVTTDIIFTIENGQIKDVQVLNGATIDGNLITMVDGAMLTDVQISKQNIFGKELEGAELTLTGKDANGSDIAIDRDEVTLGNGAQFNGGTNTELKWISGSTPTFIGNLPNGTYTLHEVAAPTGYTVTTDIIFTIENGVVTGVQVEGGSSIDGGKIIIIDDMVTDVEISKGDVLGNEVAGAELTLTGKDANGNAVKFSTSDVELGNGAALGDNTDETKLSWTSGSTATLIKNLVNGTYTLHEVAAPDGYAVTTDIIFTVENGKITGTQVQGGSTVEDGKVTMIDEILTDVSISKSNVLGNEIQGAELTLTGKDADGNAVEFDTTNVVLGDNAELGDTSDSTKLTWTSGSTDTLVKNLPNGTYTLHEVAAPSGYAVTTDIIFTIENGTITGVQVEGGSTVEDGKVTMVDDMIVDVAISKANTVGEEIAGAELTLTGKDANGSAITFDTANVELGEGAELGDNSDNTELKWTSGTTATLVKGLPNGTYTLHEVAAPNGYEVTTDITFTVNNGQVTGSAVSGNTVTMIDAKTGEAVISKANVFGDEVKGATLVLTGTDADGNAVTFDLSKVELGNEAAFGDNSDNTKLTWISGSSATIVRDLPNGTYTLHETAAPSGYEVTTDITFTVTDGKLSGGTEVTGNTVTMIDDMIQTDVTISKADVFGDEVKGAQLKLTGVDSNGDAIEFHVDFELGTDAKLQSGAGTELIWTSGSTSTLIKGLTDGTYTLHEEAAPSGFVVTTDITFTIENGVLTGGSEVSGNTVTMTDDFFTTDVAISKANTAGEEIAGATLTLTGKDTEGNDVTFDIANVVLGDDAALGDNSDNTKLTWISGTTETLVKNLRNGTYTLHEVAAPSGYVVTTDIIFTIEDGNVTGVQVMDGSTIDGSKITMLDDAEVTTTTTATTTTTETTTTTTATTTNGTTTTTTNGTTTTITAVTTTVTTTTSTAKTTAKAGSTSAPKTGDKGVAIPLFALAMAAVAALALRSKKDEE